MAQTLAGHGRGYDSWAVRRLDEVVQENDILRETYADAAASLLAFRADEEGWSPLNTLRDSGFSLDSLHKIADHAELQTTGNPLLKRGLTLRTSNVFGRGLILDGKVPPRFKAVMDKPVNQNALFTQSAFFRNERALFTGGNLFMAYNKKDKNFFAIPFSEITNSASNPNLREDVWYYERTYNKVDPNTGQKSDQPIKVWYPVLERAEAGSLPSSVQGVTLDKNIVIIDVKVNMPIGGVWGVPDCLPAMPYAWAHAEYLRDGSKLLKALATIAWKVVSKSKSTATTAGVKQANPKLAGGTAIMTNDTDMVAMPRAGQVDLRDGLQIAAYVASALEVSLISLTSDAGSAAGSYGAAATLIGPEAATARGRQAIWITFYSRCYRAIGFNDIDPNFPKIAEDPIFRQAQTISLLFAGGAIWQDEYRAAALEIADIPDLHGAAVPPPTEFTNASQFSVAAINASAAQADAQAKQSQATAQGSVTGQGKSSGVGKTGGTRDLQNMDTTPGTAA
jgi:hypothetical protein